MLVLIELRSSSGVLYVGELLQRPWRFNVQTVRAIAKLNRIEVDCLIRKLISHGYGGSARLPRIGWKR